MSKTKQIGEVLENIYDKVRTKADHIIDLDNKIDTFLKTIYLEDISYTKKRMKYLIKKNPNFTFEFFCNLIEYHENQKSGAQLPVEYFQKIIDQELEINEGSIKDLEEEYFSLIKFMHQHNDKKFNAIEKLQKSLDSLSNHVAKQNETITTMKNILEFHSKLLISRLEMTPEEYLSNLKKHIENSK